MKSKQNSSRWPWATVGPSAFLVLLASTTLGRAGGLPLPSELSPNVPEDLPVSQLLFVAIESAMSRPGPGGGTLESEPDAAMLDAALAQWGLTSRDGRIHVEIVGTPETGPLPTGSLEASGVRIDRTYQRRTDAEIPADRVFEVARALPPGFRIEPVNEPVPADVTGEGPFVTVTNSAPYRAGGADGTGITIGVIDIEFSGFSTIQASGDGPPPSRTTIVNLSGYDFEDLGTHGSSCVEAIYDHAPGATYRIYQIDSSADLGTVAFDAIANGVDILSCSVSWYGTGWPDDTGDVCDAVNTAANSGVLFVNSAGNDAGRHWQGHFEPGELATIWHDWALGDETLDVTIAAGQTANFRLMWNAFEDTADLRLFLYDLDGNELGQSLDVTAGYERLTWTNTSGAPFVASLGVMNLLAQGTPEFEVFGDNSIMAWELPIAASSTVSPANCTALNVITVGAVPWTQYALTNGADPIAGYSSNGPTNSGFLVPDIVGPTNTTGLLAPTGFTGTSCAAPNVAGAIAAFWSDTPQFSANSLNGLILVQASALGKDWGDTGVDFTYGYGGCRIVDFVPNTTWASRIWNNVAESPFAPYYTIAAAEQAATPGGRLLVFPGGDYPEAVTLTKPLTVETVAYPAWLGASSTLP